METLAPNHHQDCQATNGASCIREFHAQTGLEPDCANNSSGVFWWSSLETWGLPQELECFWLQEPVPERSEEERRQAPAMLGAHQGIRCVRVAYLWRTQQVTQLLKTRDCGSEQRYANMFGLFWFTPISLSDVIAPLKETLLSASHACRESNHPKKVPSCDLLFAGPRSVKPVQVRSPFDLGL